VALKKVAKLLKIMWNYTSEYGVCKLLLLFHCNYVATLSRFFPKISKFQRRITACNWKLVICNWKWHHSVDHKGLPSVYQCSCVCHLWRPWSWTEVMQSARSVNRWNIQNHGPAAEAKGPPTYFSQLLKQKGLLPILPYHSDVSNVDKRSMQSLDFTMNSFFVKLFNTSNMEIIVNYYETLYGCDLPACDGRTDGQTDRQTN